MDTDSLLSTRRLPRIYLAVAHVALLLALASVAVAPQKAGGFFLSNYTVYAVHLVTLGFLVHTAVGVSYLAAPLVLGREPPRRRGDAWACGFILIGASGVVSHFWLAEYSGVAYSGGMLLLAFEYLHRRVRRELRDSPASRATRAMISAAWSNLTGTAFLGILLAINKHHPILPGTHFKAVYGHAHLGLAGFATLLLFAVALHLLPRARGTAPPDDRHLWRLLALLQGGVIAVLLAWIFAPGLARWAALPIATGVLYFLALVVRLRRGSSSRTRGWSLRLLHQAFVYLGIAVGLGLVLVWADMLHLDWLMAYGVIVLLGVLGPAFLGVTMWVEARDRGLLPASGFALWTLGVPALAYGMGARAPAWIEAGSWILFAGAAAAAITTCSPRRPRPGTRSG